MTKEEVKTLALAAGFKLKTQPDGGEDLNPYVYRFAGTLLLTAREQRLRDWVTPDNKRKI